jgi:hypothetical protein
MNRTVIGVAAAVLAAAGIAFFAWQPRQEPAPPPPLAQQKTEEPAAAAAEPAIRHPIEAPAEAPAPAELPGLDQSDPVIRQTLVEWLGRESVQRFLQLDGFVRRIVVTVDNLGRTHAAPRLWPVTPMPDRFSVVQLGESSAIAPGNAERYAAFVAFVEQIDARRATALYRQGYPLFQRAYEELGFPGRYFNDRLVEVIDLLIAAPVPTGPIEVRLTEVKGPIPSTRPWVRYEFADPALESLSAGQKMMIRVGPDQQKRLRSKLVEVRALIAKAPPR